MRWTSAFCGAMAPLLMAAAADAAAITVLPATVGIGPGQTIQLWVSGGEQVAGLDFFLQLEDGGAEVGLGGVDTTPVITAVDLVTGTIFASNNSGQTDIQSFPLTYAGAIATASSTVAANGLLATITLDTSGFDGESFVLRTAQVLSEFGTFDTALTDGAAEPVALSQPAAVIAVPEPASLLALSALGGVMLLRPRRSRA